MTKIPKLFELMEKRKISATELSKAIGVSSGNISDWKSGRSSPSFERLSDIANFLDVTTDFLLELSSEVEMNHIQKYRTLDEEGRENVDDVLEVEYKRCTEEQKPMDWAIPPVDESDAAARRTSSDSSSKAPPSEDILISVTEDEGL